MSGQTVWVPADVFRKADILLRGTSSGLAVKEGVELLLRSDLTVAGQNPGPGQGRVDASGLLAKGLASLQNNPHEALGIPLCAKTQDIRKAYKKAALLYHPDKNPKTTPLFQAIQLACDKLSDPEERAKAVKCAEASSKAPTASYPTNGNGRAYHQEPGQHQQHYQQKKQEPPKAPPRNSEPPVQPKRDSGYERYRTASTSESSYDGSGLGKAQQDYRQRHNDAADDARKRASNAAETSKMEADQRAKDLAEKRAADARAAAMREVAAQKQRDRDEILKEGQKEYFAEQAKLMQAKLEKERLAAEATIASRRAMYGGAPTATPDSNQGQYPTSYQNKNVNVDPTIRGFKQNASRAPPAAATGKPVNTAAPTDYSHKQQEPVSSGGATYATSSDGKVRSQPQVNSKRKSVVPVPYDFKYVTVSESSVELEWKVSVHSGTPVLIQLSWRKQIATASWQSATSLINGLKCKKNNLELSPSGGSIYEFRVRAIEDLPGGMLGDRSDWTESLLVHTYKAKPMYANPAVNTRAKVDNTPKAAPEEELKTARGVPTTARGVPTPYSEPVTARSTNSKSEYHHVFEKPEQFRTKAPVKTDNPVTQGSSHSHSPSIPSIPVFTATPSSTSVPTVKVTPAVSVHLPPTAAAPVKPSHYQYPSYIYKETKPGSQKNNTTKDSSSTPETSPPSPERKEYVPSSSSTSSRCSSSTHRAVSPDHMRRHSSFVTRPTLAGRKEKKVEEKEADNITLGVNMSEGVDDYDLEVESADDVLDDDGSSDESESESLIGSGAKPKLTPPSGRNTAKTPEQMMNMSFTRTAWEGINVVSLDPGNASSSSSGARSALKHGVVSDDEYSEDIEEDVDEEEARVRGSASNSTKFYNLDDEEVVDEAYGELEMFKRERRKSSKYIRKAVSVAKVDTEKDPKEKKNSPSHRIRIKKEEVKIHRPAVHIPTSAKVAKVVDKPEEIWFELHPPEGSPDYEHAVREEPIQGSEIVGYLVPGMSVLAQAIVGTWAKVRYHKKARGKARANVRLGAKRADGWGWCVLSDTSRKHVFLESFQVSDEEIEDEEELSTSADSAPKTVPAIQHTETVLPQTNTQTVQPQTQTNTAHQISEPIIVDKPSLSRKPSASTDRGIDEWHERFDEEGGYSYFYNIYTGESSWEAPEWVEETDQASGSKYYMKLDVSDGNPLQSTWTKPTRFARLLRRTP